MTTDRPAEGAGAPARRRFPARVAKSPLFATIVLAAAAVAVLLPVVSGPGEASEGRQLVKLLVCVPVVLLRRWQLPVLVVVTAVAGMITATGHTWLLFGVLPGLALYFPAVGLPRPKSIALALAVAAALGVAVIYSAFAVRNAQPASEATELFVPLAGAWFITDSVAARRRYLAGVAAQAQRERAAEVREERVRIAREMHDVLAHAIAVITVQAGVGRRLAGKHPEEAALALGSIETIGRTAQDELRVVLGLLRDEEAGTAALAPVPRLIDLKELADTVRASGIPVELRTSGTDRRLSPSLELSIYRVMQEALTNVVKHAPGARAVAELTVSAGKIRLYIRDEGGTGGGGTVPRAGPGTGHGITGMRERVGAFGGWLVAEPVSGGGFHVIAEIPVEGAAS